MPGPTSRQPIRSSLTSAVSIWTIAGRQAVDRPRGAHPDIARAGSRRGRRRKRDRARHLAGERMDQPAVIFVARRDRARGSSGGAISCQSRSRIDADVGEHDPPAFVHRRMEPVRGLQRAEGHRQVERRDAAQARRPLSLRRRSAGRTRPSRPLAAQSRESCSATACFEPALESGPEQASMRSGAGAVASDRLRPRRSIATAPISPRRSSARPAPRRARPPRARRGAARRHSRRRHCFPARTAPARAAARRSARPPRPAPPPPAPSTPRRSCRHRSPPARLRAFARR